MSGEIIRKGDPTSHGGTVLEGSMTDICMGQPIAYINHNVYCPLCKGTFPIVEGILTTTFYGKGVAVAGMKTACGAVLIATQFTDTVEWSRGGSTKNTSKNASAKETGQEINLTSQKMAAQENIDSQFNDYFQLRDEQTGVVLPNHNYVIVRANGSIDSGTTNDIGNTHLLSKTIVAESIEVYI